MMLRPFLSGVLGVVVALLLVALVYGGFWLRDRYVEFTVMRTVVVLVACGNPAEAAKLGIACPAPRPSGNALPPPAPPVRPPG